MDTNICGEDFPQKLYNKAQKLGVEVSDQERIDLGEMFLIHTVAYLRQHGKANPNHTLGTLTHIGFENELKRHS